MTHPHWDMVLTQCGRGLDTVLKRSNWAIDFGVPTGKAYLTMWIASLLQEPQLASPYLFFYGPQNCGKSMFREAVSLLLGDEAIHADMTFLGRPFNSELKNAVFCWTVETDFSEREPLHTLVDYVTQPRIWIHTKLAPKRLVKNRTHWCQEGQSLAQCPDLSRKWITTIPVPKLDTEIPKRLLLQALKEEMPAFKQAMLTLELSQHLFTRTMSCVRTLRGTE